MTLGAGYIVVSRSFGVTIEGPDGQPREVRRLGERDVFGEIGLLGRGQRTATVTALEDGSLLSLSGDLFARLSPTDPPWERSSSVDTQLR